MAKQPLNRGRRPSVRPSASPPSRRGPAAGRRAGGGTDRRRLRAMVAHLPVKETSGRTSAAFKAMCLVQASGRVTDSFYGRNVTATQRMRFYWARKSKPRPQKLHVFTVSRIGSEYQLIFNQERKLAGSTFIAIQLSIRPSIPLSPSVHPSVCLLLTGISPCILDKQTNKVPSFPPHFSTFPLGKRRLAGGRWSTKAQSQ